MLATLVVAIPNHPKFHFNSSGGGGEFHKDFHISYIKKQKNSRKKIKLFFL